ncbi:methylated-DNA--[protein]-cysteine S-methyltransferase [Vibrio sonorensis]|uniref:methylated-DNA--[protein]-cysteine S-methyltransferase n=1 Tax=Vibrio sonorensis TaxID=1004316 RepID=UPI0008D9EDFE|nr:methylated-DNA--[protein]-cysteine S-methyltransferase [Vibrio sonorensis]
MKKYTILNTPLGLLTIQTSDKGLCGAWFETHTTRPEQLGERDDENPILTKACAQLVEYFDGHRAVFDLPIDTQGTDFQKRVWNVLQKIPYGKLCTYQDVADNIGNPKAVRAVGAANGKNPLSIIVPCHRVIGKSGKLTGYAGGVERKAALLDLEQSETE